LLGGLFCNDKLTLLHTVVLIWYCVFTSFFSRKNTDTEYWILILQYFSDTDNDTASVFFRLNANTDTSVF
jgi:hypothetical protein